MALARLVAFCEASLDSSRFSSSIATRFACVARVIGPCLTARFLTRIGPYSITLGVVLPFSKSILMTERLVHVLAHEASTPPAGGVVVAAVGRDEASLQIPKLVDLVGLEAR